MKNITTLLLSFVAISLFAQTDLEKNDLRGKIKTLEETKTKAMIRVNFIEGYQQEYKKETTYNPKGFIVEEKFFDEDNLLTYTMKYNYNDEEKLITKDVDSYNNFLKIDEKYAYENNKIIVTTTENEVPVLEKTIIFDGENIVQENSKNLEEEGIYTNEKNEYNAANQLVKKVIDYDSGDYEIYYRYNDQGLVVEEETKNGAELISKKLRQYNEHQDLIAEKMFDQDSKLKYSVEIKYEYDNQNNWILRTQFHANQDAPISNTTRKITYY